MNIYKTKDGTYINMDRVCNIDVYEEEAPTELEAHIYFSSKLKTVLWGDTAKAFLEYLDNHLLGVYAGAA